MNIRVVLYFLVLVCGILSVYLLTLIEQTKDKSDEFDRLYEQLNKQIEEMELARSTKTDKSDCTINKLLWHGEVWFDITDSTVTPYVLKRGYVAYDKTGKRIVGELDV